MALVGSEEAHIDFTGNSHVSVIGLQAYEVYCSSNIITNHVELYKLAMFIDHSTLADILEKWLASMSLSVPDGWSQLS